MTVSPVFAEDSPEFVACQQIKPAGDFNLMKQKKNCFRDVARILQAQSGDSIQPVAPSDPSGGEVAQLNARIVESESQVATLTTTNAQLQEQLTTAQKSGSKKWYTPKWLHEGSVCDPNNGLWAENGAYVYDTTEGAGLQVMLEQQV